MADLKIVDPNFRKTSVFKWTPERSKAAMLLAEGYTHQQVAEEIGKSDRSIRLWLAEMEFSAEVDRLSVMIGIASRAERLRIVKRVVRQKALSDTFLISDKDILDWLKFAQSETDGIKLNLAALASALGTDDTSLADGGFERPSKAKTG
jgi:transposase-like protein